jgi:hypothetical protein
MLAIARSGFESHNGQTHVRYRWASATRPGFREYSDVFPLVIGPEPRQLFVYLALCVLVLAAR